MGEKSVGLESSGDALLGLAGGYHVRGIRVLEVGELGGQRVKVYAIEAPGRGVSLEGSERALALAASRLRSDLEVGAVGLGWVIVHAGGDGDYLLVHSWVEGHMSRLSIFSGPRDEPAALRPASAGLAPCVWEAQVLAHENAAFVRHVLEGAGPVAERLDAWGADVLDVRVES